MKGLILTLGMLLPMGSFAQAPEPAVHNELRALRDKLVGAINSGNLEDVLSCLHKNVVFTGMNAEVAVGNEQVRAYFNRMMTGPGRVVQSVEIKPTVDALTTLYGNNTGIAYGSSIDRYTLTGGLGFTISSRWSCTLIKENGKWVIASLQSSANIFDNPILSKIKRNLYSVGAIAALVGLVAGFVLKGLLRARAA